MLIDRYLPVVGGSERQAQQLASELQKRGHAVKITTRLLTSELPQHEVITGVSVTRLKPVGLSKLANALTVVSMVRYLIQHAHEFDVIHTHTLGPLGLASILAAKRLRKPVILKAATYGDITRQNTTRQALPLYTHILRGILLPPALWNKILSQASAIIAITQEIVEEANQAGLSHIVEQIPNGVDTTQYHPATPQEKQHLCEKLGLKPSKFYLFYSGRFVQRKRVDVVLQALPHILQQHPNCHLLLAGSGTLQSDSTEDELREMVRTLGLGNNVTFLGMVDNIAEYLQAVDCFVFPSVTEGMPNAVLEAMASGLPVVASRINGVTDLLDDTSGWLFQAGDWQDFQATFLNMMRQPDEKNERVQWALKIVNSTFSIEAVAAQYITLYSRFV